MGKYTKKVDEQHSHPFLNTLRSSVRKALLLTACKIHPGKVINLFGSPDDAKGLPGKFPGRCVHLQTVSSYNATRTSDGVTYYNTYDGAVNGASNANDARSIVIYDSIWYLSADQIVKLMAEGKVIYFNVKSKPKGKWITRNPYSRYPESYVTNDGITYKESVVGGDDYAHRAANLPKKDSFCLRHGNTRVLFTRVRMSKQDELVEKGFDYGIYETVYRAHTFLSEYDDGLMTDHFTDKPLETKLIVDLHGRVKGAFIPDPDSPGVVSRLTDTEYEMCLNVTKIPAGFTWQRAATNMIVQGGFLEKREYMLEVAMMLRAREMSLGMIVMDEGLWGYFKNYFMIKVVWALVVYIGGSMFGFGCRHLDSYRCVTEGALQESAIGQNSQEARDEADGAGSDTAGVDTISGGGAGSTNGGGLTKEEAAEGKTKAKCEPKQVAKANKPVCDSPKEGTPAPAKQGGENGKPKGATPPIGKGKPNQTPPSSGKGHGVGGKAGSNPMAGKAPAGAKAPAGGGKASSGASLGKGGIDTRQLAIDIKQLFVDMVQSNPDREWPAGYHQLCKAPISREDADTGNEGKTSSDENLGHQAQKSPNGPNVEPPAAGAKGGPVVDRRGNEPGAHQPSVPESGAVNQSSAGNMPDAAGDAGPSWTLVQCGRDRTGQSTVPGKRSYSK
jgi:hypothetical protein